MSGTLLFVKNNVEAFLVGFVTGGFFLGLAQLIETFRQRRVKMAKSDQALAQVGERIYSALKNDENLTLNIIRHWAHDEERVRNSPAVDLYDVLCLIESRVSQDTTLDSSKRDSFLETIETILGELENRTSREILHQTKSGEKSEISVVLFLALLILGVVIVSITTYQLLFVRLPSSPDIGLKVPPVVRTRPGENKLTLGFTVRNFGNEEIAIKNVYVKIAAETGELIGFADLDLEILGRAAQISPKDSRRFSRVFNLHLLSGEDAQPSALGRLEVTAESVKNEAGWTTQASNFRVQFVQ